MKIINVTKDTLLADEAKMANTSFTRLVGLLNRSSLKKGEALILAPSHCIHSFFMRFPIDVLFLDSQNRVIKTITPLKPWRLTSIYFKSVFTLELPSGVIKSTSTQEGDTISIF